MMHSGRFAKVAASCGTVVLAGLAVVWLAGFGSAGIENSGAVSIDNRGASLIADVELAVQSQASHHRQRCGNDPRIDDGDD